jgi:hypothetical protein
MDTVNHFFTPAMVRHARAEYFLGFLSCIALMLIHWSSLNIWVAIVLFAYIDLAGTIPGLIAYHRSPTGQISRAYYVVYDVLHSAVTQGVFVIVYVEIFAWHWALLAIPAHLFIDRSLFNNYPKPFGVAFDPVRHPAIDELTRSYQSFDSSKADWKAIKAASTQGPQPEASAVVACQ